MTNLTCAEAREAAPEFALRVLPQPQRSEVAAHLVGCRNCRDEVAALTEIATRLLDAVPGTEPPLGFDRAVLLQVQSGRRRRRVVAARVVAARVAAVAICLFVAGTVLAITVGRPHAPTPGGLVGMLRENGVLVGTLTAGGHPAWVSVSVRGLAVSGPVSCQLVGGRGSVQSLGQFDLVHGSGNWAAPDPASVGKDRQARLVDHAGEVIATATLR